MRYLGIDYGARRIGLALSDESGKIAFPEAVLSNDKYTLGKIKKLCEEKKVGKIILGESLNYKREANLIMGEIKTFREKLGAEIGLEIILEPEWLTSALAARSGADNLDSAAAALILQTYLDRL